jgi:putative GTP pyrophosphokinase
VSKEVNEGADVSFERLRNEYNSVADLAEHFGQELSHQLNQLVEQKDISLSFPIQYRVKTWSSISEKIERKSLQLHKLSDLKDLVGLRLILQFKRDIDTVCQLIESNFEVIEQDDAQQRLQEDQFGYASIHFVIRLPESWLAVPTLSDMRELRAEIQVRTTAQHIWAAASHTLQYKHEQSVPLAIRRAIHRVSALLETVDLEFERVLDQRTVYREELSVPGHSDFSNGELNVDLLEKTLDALLPSDNKEDNELYAALLEDLGWFGVNTPKALVDLINRHHEAILEEDESVVTQLRLTPEESRYRVEDSEGAERLRKGVFFTHTGLARAALNKEFPDSWQKYAERYDR